jgi:hypothetical protein
MEAHVVLGNAGNFFCYSSELGFFETVTKNLNMCIGFLLYFDQAFVSKATAQERKYGKINHPIVELLKNLLLSFRPSSYPC